LRKLEGSLDKNNHVETYIYEYPIYKEVIRFSLEPFFIWNISFLENTKIWEPPLTWLFLPTNANVIIS